MYFYRQDTQATGLTGLTSQLTGLREGMNQKLLFVLAALFSGATVITYLLPGFTNGRASEAEIAPFLYSFGIGALVAIVGAFTRKKAE